MPPTDGAIIMIRESLGSALLTEVDVVQTRHGHSSTPSASAADLDALGERAKRYDHRIVARSVDTARDYWRLGRILEAAREIVRKRKKKGLWYRWLEQHALSRHRADRARLLATAFDTPAELHNLTVEEATALAKRRRPPAAQKLAKKLRRRLDEMAKAIDRSAADAEALADEHISLLASADRLTDAISRFRRKCQASQSSD